MVVTLGVAWSTIPGARSAWEGMLSHGRGWWVRRADINTVHVLPLGGTCGRRGEVECEDVERARPEAVRQLERLDALDRGKDSRIDLEYVQVRGGPRPSGAKECGCGVRIVDK